MAEQEKQQPNRREFLTALLGGGVAAGAAATAGIALNDERAEAQQANTRTLEKLLTTDGKTTRLVDQNGKVFEPASLNGQVVMATSGFHGCPACEKIKRTLLRAYKDVQNKGVKVVVFNLLPEDNQPIKQDYLKTYSDLGFNKDDMTILFTEKRVNGQWVPDNEAANVMENSLMLDSTKGHSTSIFVFDKAGQRMGKGTFAVVDPSNTNQQTEKAREVVGEVNKALGVRR